MFTWKRITANLFIFVLLLNTIMTAHMSPSYGITAVGILSAKVENNQEIYEGDEFTITITLSGAAQRVVLEDTSNFKPVDGTTTWGNSIGASIWKMNLISQGKENELKLKISPLVNDPSYDFTATVAVPGFKKSGGTMNSIDTFSVGTNETRLLIAGTKTTLEIPINVQNTSILRDVVVTMTRDDTLFSSDETKYTAKIPVINKEFPTTVKFDVKVKPSAKSKRYDLKLQFKYTSVTGTVFQDETNNVYSVKVNSNQVEPTVDVTDYSFQGSKVAAGAPAQKLNLVLKNSGTLDATDIKVKLSGFDKDKIRLSKDNDTKIVSSLVGGKEASISYSINAAPNAKSENVELAAEINYIDENGNPYKTTSKVYVPIDGIDPSSVDLAVANLKHADVVKSKGGYSIAFDLKNQGKIDARTVEVSIEYPNATLVPKSTPKKVIRTFKAGQTQHFNFDLMAKEEAQTGFADVYVNVKYNVEGGKDTDALTLREFAGVFVEGSQGLGRPKVIIENYNFGGTTVLSGQEFDLYLDLFNTSSEESIKNIKVSLKADDGVFAPVDMSSSFFVERIEAQDRQTKVIRMKTKNDAQVKAYNILVTFQYEDSKGNAYDAQKNPYKEEETITIPVNQPVRIETGEPSFNPENYLNQPTPVSLEFFNMGKSTVYNLMVKAEGDFQVQGSNYFVGNFEPGRSDFFETQVMPTVEGTAKGKIIFIYEDANGVPGQFEKPFSMNVMGAPVDPGTNPDGQNPDGSIDPNIPTGPMPHAKLIIVGILAGIGAIFGGVIIWKRRLEKAKSLKQEDFDE